MELRVLKRRDLTGSMTIVGDMGQATTASSSASWDALLEVLAPRRAADARRPHGQLPHARRGSRLRRADAAGGRPRPRAAATRSSRGLARRSSFVVSDDEFVDDLVELTRSEIEAVAPGRVAVIVTGRRVEEIVTTLRDGGLDAVDPSDQESKGLAADLVVLAAEGANGLEFDAVVVVEPGQIANRGAHGRDDVHAARTAHALRRVDASDPATRRHRDEGTSADTWLRADSPDNRQSGVAISTRNVRRESGSFPR